MAHALIGGAITTAAAAHSRPGAAVERDGRDRRIAHARFVDDGLEHAGLGGDHQLGHESLGRPRREFGSSRAERGQIDDRRRPPAAGEAGRTRSHALRPGSMSPLVNRRATRRPAQSAASPTNGCSP